MPQIISALRVALTRAVAFLPALLSAIVILVVGWILAAILRGWTRRGLERIGFNSLVQRGRVAETMERTGAAYEPAAVVAGVVFWAVLLTTFLLAANALGLVGISALLTRLVAFLPLVFVAIIELVVAVAIGELAYEATIASIGDRVEGASAIAVAAKWGIIAFGVFAALSQLQISPAIVNSLFIMLVGAIAIAFAIAFGVGNIDLAKDITRGWYQRSLRTGEAGQEEKPERPAA